MQASINPYFVEMSFFCNRCLLSSIFSPASFFKASEVGSKASIPVLSLLCSFVLRQDQVLNTKKLFPDGQRISGRLIHICSKKTTSLYFQETVSVLFYNCDVL